VELEIGMYLKELIDAELLGGISAVFVVGGCSSVGCFLCLFFLFLVGHAVLLPYGHSRCRWRWLRRYSGAHAVTTRVF